MRIRTLALISSLSFVAASGVSHAALQTYTYTGAVIQKNVGLAQFTAPWNNPGIVVGSPMTFTYTFEDSVPDASGAPTSGSYAALSVVTLTVGPFTVTNSFAPALSPTIFVLDNQAGVDQYQVFQNNMGGNAKFTFSLGDSTGNVFNTDALPLTQPDPTLFNSPYIELESGGFIDHSRIRFSVDPIPEPTCLALLTVPASFSRRRRG